MKNHPKKTRGLGQSPKPAGEAQKGRKAPPIASGSVPRWQQLALIPLDILVLDDTNNKKQGKEANEPDDSGRAKK